jgi:predicted transcriptional regulator YdeE
VHKDVSQVPIDELLNLLLFISVSETFYKDFDDKQVVYINQALDIIESQFTGTETITTQKSPNRDDTVTLSFFKQISIPIKTYNKQAIRQTNNKMQKETKKAREALFASSESEHSESEELEVIDDPLLGKSEEVQMEAEQQAAP